MPGLVALVKLIWLKNKLFTPSAMYVYNPVMCEYAHDDFYFSGIGGGWGLYC